MRNDIPTTDPDWAAVVMAKLERLEWRFSLNDQGRFTVTIGRPDDTVPTGALMELLGEWSHHCEHVLRSRGALMAAAGEPTIH